jgi:hypothetical protein
LQIARSAARPSTTATMASGGGIKPDEPRGAFWYRESGITDPLGWPLAERAFKHQSSPAIVSLLFNPLHIKFQCAAILGDGPHGALGSAIGYLCLNLKRDLYFPSRPKFVRCEIASSAMRPASRPTRVASSLTLP